VRNGARAAPAIANGGEAAVAPLALATLLTSSSPLTVLEDLRAWSDAARDPDPLARIRMFAEFRAHALRDERARSELARRERDVRAAFAKAIRAQFAAVGLDPPGDIDDLATIVHILDTYAPLENAIDPDHVRAGFLFDALTLLLRAGVALASAEQSSSTERRRARTPR
jgi:hypothetical protein